MKNIYLLIIFSIITIISVAQNNLNWITLNVGTNENINDIYFHNSDTGYIVGDNYLFKKTTDGGLTWTNLNPPSISEKPGNNGRIIGIDYHKSFSFSHLDSGMYLTWEKGYHGVSTGDDGQTYNRFNYSDSTQFCKINGFSILPANRGNGYANMYTYGEDCMGNAVYYNYYDGPFSIFYSDTLISTNTARFTTVDADSFSSIFGHSNGYLLRYKGPFSTFDSTLLDTFGVSAVAYAGNHKWYACTNRDMSNMYVSTDSGKTFSVDNSFNPNLFINPTINEFSFLTNGRGIGGALVNGNKGGIVVKDSNQWVLYNARQPINTVKLFDNGRAFAAGDSGLFMTTNILTSVKSIKGKSHLLNIYPNPVNNVLHLEGLESIKVNTIQLFDGNGKLVDEFDPIDRKINLSNYSKGIYIISVVSDESQLSRKLIVE